MGVKLKDIVEPESISFKDLEGRTVSIDAFNTLFQFLSTIRQRDGRPLTDENGNITSHLSGILYRNSSMIEKDIKPIYIFDGQAPELKSETQAKRREIRDEAEKIYKDALAKGDTEKARKFAMRSSKLSPEIIESSKKLLTLMGIPYIDAKGEGEAQAAYLVQNGDAYAVASQDYDCLLFGAKRVVRNLAVNSNLGNLEYYQLNKVLKELNVTREELVDMGILIGTDFCDGLKGVGAKTALKLAHKGQLKEKIAELQKQSSHDLDEVREIFLNHNVNTDYKIKWEKPNKDKIIEFLCYEHGFSEDRVSKASDKLKNLNSSQGSLDAWF
ncbi:MULTISPECIES: flap endonuclease-1 [Methanobrevibacter]|uniref:flap endonuclease-1 n=1 Tax=Methanobrevibacter TaxID=2172 RepID=UPI0015BED392|nr:MULTISPECIES: flap endonuclease-1 [Methanobrevibacter]MBS7257803.1 flap endonuclease-1 [Methanobrevibacter sp.]MCI7428944.1 flap endonuclease-1 [Methanobrevibacter sp.]MDD6777313.1 flap endonuclease-1 [Methanobacteriaceae archaeon]